MHGLSALVSESGITGLSDVLFAGALAGWLAWVMVPAVRLLALRYGVIDAPTGRRVHTTATPRLGGLAVMAALVVSAVFCMLGDTPGMQAVVPYLALAVGLMTVGAIDDIRGLRPSAKMAGTILAAAIAASLGLRIDVIALPWGAVLSTGHLAIPLTVFWVVAICHAVNLIDGLDGLAGTVTLVATLAAAYTNIHSGQYASAGVAVALAGALLGFLRWNWTPAKIFLGDAGSLGVGGLVAVLTLMPETSTGVNLHSLDVTTPLLLAYPIVDTTLAVLRRWLRGVPITVADRGHIHQRMLDSGLRQPLPTVALAGWSLVAAALGLVLRHDISANSRLSALILCGSLLLGALWTLRRLGVRELQQLARTVESVRRTWRRVIREHIQLADAAEQLAACHSFDEVDVMLIESARRLNLQGAELTRSSARRRLPPHPDGSEATVNAASLWSLDWPVTLLPGSEDDPIVLRVYGSAAGPIRPHTASRMAEAILPPLGAWLTAERQRELLERRPGARRGRRTDDRGEAGAEARGEQRGEARREEARDDTAVPAVREPIITAVVAPDVSRPAAPVTSPDEAETGALSGGHDHPWGGQVDPAEQGAHGAVAGWQQAAGVQVEREDVLGSGRRRLADATARAETGRGRPVPRQARGQKPVG